MRFGGMLRMRMVRARYGVLRVHRSDRCRTVGTLRFVRASRTRIVCFFTLFDPRGKSNFAAVRPASVEDGRRDGCRQMGLLIVFLVSRGWRAALDQWLIGEIAPHPPGRGCSIPFGRRAAITVGGRTGGSGGSDRREQRWYRGVTQA